MTEKDIAESDAAHSKKKNEFICKPETQIDWDWSVECAGTGRDEVIIPAARVYQFRGLRGFAIRDSYFGQLLQLRQSVNLIFHTNAPCTGENEIENSGEAADVLSLVEGDEQGWG